MKTILFTILIYTTLLSCDNTQNKKVTEAEIVSDNGYNHKTNSLDTLNKSICHFLNPDTSLSGIILRNPATALRIIGAANKIDSFGLYHFYSKDKKETLTLTQHSGDENNQISIFKVELAYNANKGYKKLNIETFKTEKGIKLGLTKSELISILGDCYKIIENKNNEIEFQYFMELPNDSKTNILTRNKMPIYFANYEFLDDKLVSMEFGFENP